MDRRAGLVGFGYAVPANVRTNDDPVFDELRSAKNAEVELFAGMFERRYLKPEESIEDLMVEAGRQAIADAGLEPGQIDRLYGYSFVSQYLTPNGLYRVHQGLGLDPKALVVPINCEYSNFVAAIIMAWEAIACGHARYVMVNCGASMTRNMDYTRGHSVSAGDGAGAVIVGPSDRFRVVDYETRTLSHIFDVINVGVHHVDRGGARAIPMDEDGLPVPVCEIKEEGLGMLTAEGVEVPPALVRALLERHGIDPGQVALIAHQPTRKLMNRWRDSVQPGEYLDTYDRYGNVTIASAAITLASFRGSMRSRYVAIVCPGTGTHFTALLLER